MAKTFDENESYTQDDGAIELETYSYNNDVNQVSWLTDSTTGTLAVSVKYHPLAQAEKLLDEDGSTQLIIDLSDPESFIIYDKFVYSIIFTPTDVDESYTPLLTSGTR